MFHDIQDMSTWHLGNWSGGVPAFWANLAQNVAPQRMTAITFQIATAQPVFGLGILRPGPNASAEPDVPTAEWASWPDVRQLMAQKSRHALTGYYCERADVPHNFARACSMLKTSKF